MSKYIGQKYGALKVLDARTARTSGGNPKVLLKVRCDCGRVFERAVKRIQKAKHPTCRECYKHPEPKMFGNQHPLYDTWAEMHRRCKDPRRPKYQRYGGRGITVDPRWDDFEAFVRDMGPKPTTHHTLDRVDNDGPYSPENCRWATYEEQYRNRRAAAPTDVTLGKHTKSVNAWSKLLCISSQNVRNAISRGEEPKRAILREMWREP
jgi:hypothetical protein